MQYSMGFCDVTRICALYEVPPYDRKFLEYSFCPVKRLLTDRFFPSYSKAPNPLRSPLRWEKVAARDTSNLEP